MPPPREIRRDRHTPILPPGCDNFRLKPDEVAYIVEHSGAEVLLVDPEVADSCQASIAKHVIVFGEETDAIF